MATAAHVVIILFHNLLSNGHQTFHSSSMNEYRDGIISCENSDCKIICDQPNGCRNTQINCPIAHSCDITCSTTKACDSALIIATLSSSLTIHNCATGSFACNGISIYLPPNNNGIPRAIIDGGDDELSQAAGNNDTFYEQVVVPMNLYAIYGWNDIGIVNYDGSLNYQGGIMHCTVDYSSSCSFSNNVWECEDPNHVCNHAQKKYPITSAYFIDKSGLNDEADSTSNLWYIANILLICVIAVILVFAVCIIRFYRTEKELIGKCNESNDELIKLRKLYDDSSMNRNTSPLSDMNNSSLSSTKKRVDKRRETLTDENVAVEILTTPQSMMSIDADIEYIKTPSTNTNCIEHSPIIPNDEWDRQMNSRNDSEIPYKQCTLKLSDIPTPNSFMVGIDKKTTNSMATYYTESLTMTKTTMSLNLFPKTINHSDNSSMFVAFHEMDNGQIDEIDLIESDGSISTIVITGNDKLECKPQTIASRIRTMQKKECSNGYEYAGIFVPENLSILNDGNEEEFD